MQIISSFQIICSDLKIPNEPFSYTLNEPDLIKVCLCLNAKLLIRIQHFGMSSYTISGSHTSPNMHCVFGAVIAFLLQAAACVSCPIIILELNECARAAFYGNLQ